LIAYADSSVLVALYIWDSHSLAAKEMVKSDLRVCFTPLHLAECCHAIAQQVFQGRILPDQAEVAYEDLQRDLSAGVWVETAIPESAFVLCAELGRRYGPKIAIRTLDTLHVACALELKADRFLTFDDRQKKLAKTQGLKLA
jgi:predicted nucleic acid-binding protein